MTENVINYSRFYTIAKLSGDTVIPAKTKQKNFEILIKSLTQFGESATHRGACCCELLLIETVKLAFSAT